MDGKYYLTIPIFYPNARLHMGHAYTTTVGDVIARFHRKDGNEVYFLAGSDENTEKMVRAAKKEGKEVKAYLDEIAHSFVALYDRLGISYDQFIRTSDEVVHWPGVREVWQRLVDAGYIEKRTYTGLYCVGHEAFMTEKDLVDGRCPDHDEAPQELSEENYFFLLSRHTETLKEKIQSGELDIVPAARKNEVLALLESGLEDISFSRPKEKMTVGVPVPGDDSQRVYVWGDALVNYISALGFGTDNDALYKKFWPADVHIVGKDIIRFHAVIWPAMLLSAGIPLPKKILAHGFLTSGGRKMSKTLGNVIDPVELLDGYGAEALRYYLLRYAYSFEDRDITKEHFHAAYNADLANGIGNLTSRIMKMATSYLNEGVSVAAGAYDASFEDAMREFRFSEAMDIVWGMVAELDDRIQKEQPFKVVKEDAQKAEQMVTELVKKLHVIAYHLEVLLPETSRVIKESVENHVMPESLFKRIDE